MKTINYHSTLYSSTADGDSLEKARCLTYTDHIDVSNDLVIVAARVLVKIGVITDDVQVVYKEDGITRRIEKDGSIENQPNGVLDLYFKELFGF